MGLECWVTALWGDERKREVRSPGTHANCSASQLSSTIHAAAWVTCAILAELSRRFAVRLFHPSCEIRLSITLCVTVQPNPVVCRYGHLLNAGYRTCQDAFLVALLLGR